MKDNCVCINGTCTTKYNTCQFESPLVCSSMARSWGWDLAQWLWKEHRRVQNITVMGYKHLQHELLQQGPLRQHTLAIHFWSPDIICAALKFCYQGPLVRVLEWPARAFEHHLLPKCTLHPCKILLLEAATAQASDTLRTTDLHCLSAIHWHQQNVPSDSSSWGSEPHVILEHLFNLQGLTSGCPGSSPGDTSFWRAARSTDLHLLLPALLSPRWCTGGFKAAIPVHVHC